MEVIPSFQIDHTNLKPGIYISRQDKVDKETITTYDIRMTHVNHEPAISPAAMHTIEHLAATWFRNHEWWKKDIIYWGPMGCHSKGTKILMFDGSVKCVENIVVGDTLMGVNSEPIKVLNLIQGNDTLYEINQNNGDTYIVNGKHLLHLWYSKDDGKYGMKKGDTIDITVEDFIKKSEKFKRNFKGYKEGYDGVHQDLPIDPYILGLWLGDGNRTKPTLVVADNEPEIATSWIKYGEELGLHYNIENQKGRCKCYSLHHELNPHKPNLFVEKIKQIGVYGHKHIPLIYLNADREQRLKLLAGLINTDGWCPIRRGINQERLIFGNTNIELLEGTKQLANSLGFNAHYKMVKDIHRSVMPNGKESVCQPYYYLYISGNVTELNIWLLPHKRPNKRLSNNNHLLSKLTIKEIGVGDYYGFETNGNHLYHLSDCTICHNCLTGSYLIVKGNHDMGYVRDSIMAMLEYIINFDDEIPGSKPEECGNYLLHNLPEAKYACEKYLDWLINDFHSSYPLTNPELKELLDLKKKGEIEYIEVDINDL